MPDGVVVGRRRQWQRSVYRPELIGGGNALSVGRVLHVHVEALPQVSVPGALCLSVSIPEEDDHGQEQNGTCSDYTRLTALFKIREQFNLQAGGKSVLIWSMVSGL